MTIASQWRWIFVHTLIFRLDTSPMVYIVSYHRSRDHANPLSPDANLAQSVGLEPFALPAAVNRTSPTLLSSSLPSLDFSFVTSYSLVCYVRPIKSHLNSSKLFQSWKLACRLLTQSKKSNLECNVNDQSETRILTPEEVGSR